MVLRKGVLWSTVVCGAGGRYGASALVTADLAGYPALRCKWRWRVVVEVTEEVVVA